MSQGQLQTSGVWCKAMFVHTIFHTEENNLIGFHMMVCVNKKKKHQIDKTFTFVKRIKKLDPAANKPVAVKLISFSSGIIMRISKCYILVLVKC